MLETRPVQQNASLKSFNTFGIEAQADFFAWAQTVEQLAELLREPEIREIPKLILGEGSNILFTQNYRGMIIKNAIKGISIFKEDHDYVWVRAGAGENWHQFVLHCVEQGYGGIENLSLIPGTVGAAPIQNIGAYGAELSEIFSRLEAINLQDGHFRIFTHEACQFGYRDSIFKNLYKNQFVITAVELRLLKKPKLNLEYSALQNALRSLPIEDINIKIISEAVIDIRRSKLPDPKILGNAGSFFKNPIIPQARFLKLQKRFLNLPHFIQNENAVKINAAWLIEKSGWKGKRWGNVGVYDKQALVLVNFGNGKGKEILELATKIQCSVLEQFEIFLEPEVHFI